MASRIERIYICDLCGTEGASSNRDSWVTERQTPCEGQVPNGWFHRRARPYYGAVVLCPACRPQGLAWVQARDEWRSRRKSSPAVQQLKDKSWRDKASTAELNEVYRKIGEWEKSDPTPAPPGREQMYWDGKRWVGNDIPPHPPHRKTEAQVLREAVSHWRHVACAEAGLRRIAEGRPVEDVEVLRRVSLELRQSAIGHLRNLGHYEPYLPSDEEAETVSRPLISTGWRLWLKTQWSQWWMKWRRWWV